MIFRSLISTTLCGINKSLNFSGCQKMFFRFLIIQISKRILCTWFTYIRMHIHECTTLCHINKSLKFSVCQKRIIRFSILQKGLYSPGLHIRINPYM